jgi:hypothetical protein
MESQSAVMVQQRVAWHGMAWHIAVDIGLAIRE